MGAHRLKLTHQMIALFPWSLILLRQLLFCQAECAFLHHLGLCFCPMRNALKECSFICHILKAMFSFCECYSPFCNARLKMLSGMGIYCILNIKVS